MFHSPDGSDRQIRGRLNLGCNKRERKTEYNCNVEKIVLSENTNYNKSLNYELAQQISPQKHSKQFGYWNTSCIIQGD